MQEGPHSWVPNFFVQEDYTLFVEGDSVSWIRLPLGFCRRNPKPFVIYQLKRFLHIPGEARLLSDEELSLNGSAWYSGGKEGIENTF